MITTIKEPYKPVQLKSISEPTGPLVNLRQSIKIDSSSTFSEKMKSKIYPYNGLPKEMVLKIHQFVLKIREQKNLGQRSIAKEIKKDFGVNISENTISGWIHRHIIPFAQEETQFKSKPVPSKGVLQDLYLKRKESASTIAKKFNVSIVTAINWLITYGIKVRNHTESMNTPNIRKELANLQLKRPIKEYQELTPEKAYLFGVLCGDGYIDEKRIKLEIRKDAEFITEFSSSLEKVYGLKYHYKYYAKRNSLLLDISSMIISKDLRKYGSFKTKTWRVPNEVMISNNKMIISNFLRGLYDSDGSVGFYIVSLTSSSGLGVKDIQSLLLKFRIQSKIKEARGKYHQIYITHKRNIDLFKEKIGFTIRRKQRKFSTMYKLKR